MEDNQNVVERAPKSTSTAKGGLCRYSHILTLQVTSRRTWTPNDTMLNCYVNAGRPSPMELWDKDNAAAGQTGEMDVGLPIIQVGHGSCSSTPC